MALAFCDEICGGVCLKFCKVISINIRLGIKKNYDFNPT